jgi:hypothetical protein
MAHPSESHLRFLASPAFTTLCLIKPRKTSTTANWAHASTWKEQDTMAHLSQNSCDIGDLQNIRVPESQELLGKENSPRSLLLWNWIKSRHYRWSKAQTAV